MSKEGGSSEKIHRFPSGSLSIKKAHNRLYVLSYNGGWVASWDGEKSTPIASDIPKPVDFVATSEHIFVATEKDGGIWRMSLQGKNRKRLISNQVNHEWLKIEGENLYYREWSGAKGEHSIRSIPLEGGDLQVVVSDLYEPSGVFFDAQYMYVAEKGKSWIRRYPHP